MPAPVNVLPVIIDQFLADQELVLNLLFALITEANSQLSTQIISQHKLISYTQLFSMSHLCTDKLINRHVLHC